MNGRDAAQLDTEAGTGCTPRGASNSKGRSFRVCMGLVTPEDIQHLAERLAEVRLRIGDAALRASRKPESIQLCAVSKTKPASAIRAAYEAGQRDFGENYVQELLQKAEELRDLSELRWHAIGTLQRNKAKDVAKVAALVHTVDRAELARDLGKRALALGRVLPVLVEVNIAGEASKSGCAPDEAGALIGAVAETQGLQIRGLMTMPPFDDDPERSRPYFRALYELRERHGGSAALPELSMGMSHDFGIAIEEGATIVRVGTAIFGARS